MMTGLLRICAWASVCSLLLFGAVSLPVNQHGWAAEDEAVTLKVEGMGCRSCIKEVRSALMKVPGVKAAQVKVKKRWLFFNDYSDARAVVEFEPGKTTPRELIKAIENSSTAMFTYKAWLVE